MERKDDDQLWDILGRVPTRPVSPFFARNVLREIRKEPRWKTALGSWLSLCRLVPVAGAALAIIAGLMFVHQPAVQQQSAPAETDPVIAKIDPQDYEVVADLDDLLASEENKLWDDTSSL